ncbi:alpha,alpha-trehalase [bacterium]|nr:alpha,alpha-trehalase [bacterium]
MRKILIVLFLILLAHSVTGDVTPSGSKASLEVEVQKMLAALEMDEDTDGDKRITVNDPHVSGTERGDKRFWLTAEAGAMEVSGTYYLSNLLQELSLATEAGLKNVELETNRIFEPPVDRISRSIRELYWDGLTRRIDEAGLVKILSDEKTASVDGLRHVYVPADDQLAYKYLTNVAKNHTELKAKVDYLPKQVTADYVRKLDGYHGLLSLGMSKNADGSIQAIPFVVPGGRFNEMYGWDSYFIVLGLLQDNRMDLARAMVENFVYEINHYHQILNANRTYYLTRSQPPFLTSMTLAVYAKLPKNSESRAWLKQALEAAIQEYQQVWTNSQRLTKTGLSRYFDFGYGPPPEVEPGHFNPVYSRYAKQLNMDPGEIEASYKSGKLKNSELDAYFKHDRCMRESGHDTSYRLEDRCADLVTVDLNSLLFKFEIDLAETIQNEFNGELKLSDGSIELSQNWSSRAAKRKELMNRYLWNEKSGMFFDYDFARAQRSDYVSATTLYPLWAGLATKEQAESLIQKALPLLEMPGGIVASTEKSRGLITPEHPLRQWDYPYGWSPHQVLTWLGLKRYGYDAIAQRLIYRWLYTITNNAAQYNGTVPEKFDVVIRSHQVFAEYGNVGTKFAYITREGFGWSNASYQIGLASLPSDLRLKLNALIPPEWLLQ